MAVWFKIAIGLNLIYWTIFFYFVSRRRWTKTALAVGVFHMLFAGVVSVAPIRSFLDPDYMGYELGIIKFQKLAVVIPAALILAWALAASWIAVNNRRGRLMIVAAVGDILMSLSMAGSFIFGDPNDWKFQLGEHFALNGVPGLLVLLSLFTLPFILSAIWATRRSHPLSPTPLIADTPRPRGDNDKNDSDNSLRFSESPAQ